MKILLLGETGFLGREVSKLVLKKKNVHKFDLSQIKKIQNYLCKKNPDLIINCAVVANFKTSHSKKMLKVNFLAVKKIVEYCINNKKKFIHISGTIVHPIQKIYSINSPLRAKNYYGKTKLFADKFIIKNKKKLDYKILRLGGIYGKNGPDHLFLNKLISKKEKVFKGNLNSTKNYIHVKDAAKCINQLIKHKKGVYYAGGEIINFKKMISIIKKKINSKLEITKSDEKKTSEIVKTSSIFKIKPFGFYL